VFSEIVPGTSTAPCSPAVIQEEAEGAAGLRPGALKLSAASD
jgi:hypothetical protein